ncbi:hypothetical protein BLA29_013298, partial [Euroglyphus maynei]
MKQLGFDEYHYEPYFFMKQNDQTKIVKNPGESAAQWLMEKNIIGKQETIKQLEQLTQKPDDDILQKRFEDLQSLKEVIESFQPDLFMIDHMALEPIIVNSGKPWIKIISVAPLIYLQDFDHLPPAWS